MQYLPSGVKMKVGSSRQASSFIFKKSSSCMPSTISFSHYNYGLGIHPFRPTVGVRGRGKISQQQVKVALVAPSEVQVTNEYVEEFPLSRGHKVKVQIEERPDGSQHASFKTDLPAGRLLLHWGVEGGKDYKGGWRLPASHCRPEGTTQYKDRALQSPFKVKDNVNEIDLWLPPDEASDVLNFVLKDDATNTWYDSAGSNFKIALKHGLDLAALEQLKVEKMPKELCDKWAWLRWEFIGRPSRSNEVASQDYDAAISEMRELVKKGRTLDELWRVADGKYKYAQYRTDVVDKLLGPLKSAAAAAKKSADGASNGAQAPPAPSSKQQQGETQVGQPFDGVRQRNPLELIKDQDSAPQLSASKRVKQETPLEFLVQRAAVDPHTRWRRLYPLGVNRSEILVVVRQPTPTSAIEVDLFTDLASPLVLHWGLLRAGSRTWCSPPADMLAKDSELVKGNAADTPFHACAQDDWCDVEVMGAKVPLQRITLTLPPDHIYGGVTFVLRSDDSTMWYKDAHKDFVIPLPGQAEKDISQGTEGNDELVSSIIEAESSSAWTLMHRFNKAADLISDVLNGYYDMDAADTMARIYVWLRYSSTRHLTWQRNYNTQPRILSSAQERLTGAIASAHARLRGEAQEWVRLMFTTVGRGGDGQKIRDEILNIMHRHHISEKKGTWMEAWHQKLHNNTTPDDVDICQAYLAFLESKGNVGAYWRVLSDAGISRERLETYDRPITMEPEYMGDKRDSLIGEFRNYLDILKAVHSGADLQAAAANAGNKIPGSARGPIGYVTSHIGDSQLLPFIEAAVEARSELAPQLAGNKELLYLDLALEDEVRRAAERGVGRAGFGAAAFMKPLLQNLALSLGDNEEVCFCLKSWMELPASVRNGGRPSKEEALLAVAVVNRIRRAISTISDSVMGRIGKISVKMGRAFQCEEWAVDLFAEEVIRGGPAFAVSVLISTIDSALRNAAALGAWQVISPHEVTGIVDVVHGLHEVQEKVYTEPTVLVADQVTGEEEIPEGVVAVLTPDAPDVLSHVSVRARNMQVLFATCHDAKPLDEIRSCKGRYLHFTTTASGAVSWSEARTPSPDAAAHSLASPLAKLHMEIPPWSGRWVTGMDEYGPGVVGAKSRNLASLRGKLPKEIKLPASVTLPFGCFEQALEDPANLSIKTQLAQLASKISDQQAQGNGVAAGEAAESASQLLGECRTLAMSIKVPDVVKAELTKSMTAAGIPIPQTPERWNLAMEALKGVWASKYNARAYYSLKKVGLSFDSVRMAVLVQGVVPAEYAFVIHTKNPSTNDENEVFCELVMGLGESLVSGMVPGSSVAFKARKNALDEPEVLCYASKSEGMFVNETLIFRSDSNGEDLEGYAGAGLYESITMDTSELRKVDYMESRLVKDASFRKALLSRICKVGMSIEQAMGSAQDIEGVVGPDGSITVVQTRPQV